MGRLGYIKGCRQLHVKWKTTRKALCLSICKNTITSIKRKANIDYFIDGYAWNPAKNSQNQSEGADPGLA